MFNFAKHFFHKFNYKFDIVKISEIFRSKMARTLKRSICFIWNLEKFTHRGHNVLKIMYSNLQSMLKTLSPPVNLPKKVMT